MSSVFSPPAASAFLGRAPIFSPAYARPVYVRPVNLLTPVRSLYVPPPARQLLLPATSAQIRIFETPFLLASPPNSNGGGSINNLPPPNGAGGNGSGDDDGVKKDELLTRFELVDIFKDYITHTRKGNGPILLVGSHLNLLGNRVGQLKYIQDVSAILNEQIDDFEAEDLLDVVHFLARTIDKKIEHVIPNGTDAHEAVDEANVLKPIFRLAVELERKLLEAGGVQYKPAIKIADVHSVFARKGVYSDALGERLEEFSKPISLINTILHLSDVARRYELVDRGGSSAFALTYIREIRQFFSLADEDALAWAKEELSALLIEDHVSLVHTTREDPEVFGIMIKSFDTAWDDFTLGLYLYSPYIFEEIARTFEKYDLQKIAAQYWERAQKEREIAGKLGLND